MGVDNHISKIKAQCFDTWFRLYEYILFVLIMFYRCIMIQLPRSFVLEIGTEEMPPHDVCS